MENQNKTQNASGFKVPYSDRVGENMEREILERYKVIINYYVENPHRIADNSKKLTDLVYRDAVLKKDDHLKKRLYQILRNTHALVSFLPNENI